MRIEVLDKAERDLIAGLEFYEKQCEGVGACFLDSIFSDIESLQIYVGIHSQHLQHIELLYPVRYFQQLTYCRSHLLVAILNLFVKPFPTIVPYLVCDLLK